MANEIILLSGGTGVGTSTFSFELAKVLGVSAIISTDYVREAVRGLISPDVFPALGKSTYTAGQTKNYCAKEEDVQKAEIIRGYKTQCTFLAPSIEGIIKRAIKENVSIIIEGVHLVPGKFQESSLFDISQDRIVEYFLYISDPEVHRLRFTLRQEEAPDRVIDKYLNNFREIRWIHDYMLGRVQRFSDTIHSFDNVGSKKQVLDQILKAHYSR